MRFPSHKMPRRSQKGFCAQFYTSVPAQETMAADGDRMAAHKQKWPPAWHIQIRSRKGNACERRLPSSLFCLNRSVATIAVVPCFWSGVRSPPLCNCRLARFGRKDTSAALRIGIQMHPRDYLGIFHPPQEIARGSPPAKGPPNTMCSSLPRVPGTIIIHLQQYARDPHNPLARYLLPWFLFTPSQRISTWVWCPRRSRWRAAATEANVQTAGCIFSTRAPHASYRDHHDTS